MILVLPIITIRTSQRIRSSIWSATTITVAVAGAVASAGGGGVVKFRR